MGGWGGGFLIRVTQRGGVCVRWGVAARMHAVTVRRLSRVVPAVSVPYGYGCALEVGQ